jgi:transposase
MRKEEQTAMKAYSQDLRERVLRAVDLGRERREIVQLFGVSLATIKRYLRDCVKRLPEAFSVLF